MWRARIGASKGGQFPGPTGSCITLMVELNGEGPVDVPNDEMRAVPNIEESAGPQMACGDVAGDAVNAASLLSVLCCSTLLGLRAWCFGPAVEGGAS